MQQGELIPHLFRSEYSKIVSVLCRHFGFDRIEIAEDLAADTFLAAAQTWPLDGIPENPAAWLYTVAKNNARNYIKRHSVFDKKLVPELKRAAILSEDTVIDLSEQNITDSQLQMIFTVCHPAIPAEAQIGLALRILCGFGIEEIADAFLTNKETINKRLFRAKEKLREQQIAIEMPSSAEMEKRLATVLTTIYLLFNEGYYSVSNNQTIRKDLCYEAMRLCKMLAENKLTARPEADALLSLMCFHASRFDARFDRNGELVLYDDQDETLWDKELIAKGGYFLHRASKGEIISRYHIEAAIAYWNTQKTDSRDKWENILQLYNQLLQIEYSPVAALNRTFALAKARSKEEALIEARKLELPGSHFYFVLLGELYTGSDNKKAIEQFKQALSLAKTQTDKQSISKKISALEQPGK